MRYKSRAIWFVEFDNGCYSPLNMALNQDGYFRKAWPKNRKQNYEMFHRFIWRAYNNVDKIPKGYEINHKCNNRACCNPEHLELLSRKEHLEITNRGRYKGRIMAAKYDFLAGIGRKEIASKYSVTYSTACNWANELGWESL